jgi:hypothetical protein
MTGGAIIIGKRLMLYGLALKLLDIWMAGVADKLIFDISDYALIVASVRVMAGPAYFLLHRLMN